MIATFTTYADFKTALHAGFTTVSPTVYYFDDTGGSGNFFIYAVDWAAGSALQVSVSPKPNTFGTDFPTAVKLMSAAALS